jgi:hypothetical protein
MTQQPNQVTNRRSHRLTGRLLTDLLAVCLLWVLVIALFRKIGLAGRVLASGDVFTYFYPYWAEATRAIRAGRLPLWNPYLFMGSPFLANSQVGVFYPLNWPLWLILPAYRSVHVTILLHLCLAAFNTYLWGRTSIRLGRVGAWAAGAMFALGGYLGAQVEHVNQLQGLAWLPLILALYDRSQISGSKSHIVKPRTAFAGLVIVLALVFLAGHTQTAFVSLVGLATYGLGPPLWAGVRRCEWRPLIRGALCLVVAAGLGIALAAVQLVPTWELSRLSVRAGGLPFNERVSFSLAPLYLARALLPGFADSVPPEHIEHVAYVGVVGLALVVFAVTVRDVRRQARHFLSLVSLVFLGLFFSLGFYNPLYLLLARFVPGFAHFRVPARWLALYALGMAALAGWGADGLWLRHNRGIRRAVVWFSVVLIALTAWAIMGRRIDGGTQVSGLMVAGWMTMGALVLGLLWAATRAPRPAAVALLALAMVELFAASSVLPYDRATAPQALVSLRPAVAHLLASGAEVDGTPARFISMSDITFDPGDLPEILLIYGPQLGTDALYDYVIATKHKEVLSPNLPLAFGIPAVDGYDGGVLPLARYRMLQRLLLPEDRVSMDGRLRENLTAIPDGRWLSLFNVRHVITDKLHDAWLDDVFYDLQFGARLAAGEVATVAHVPEFRATALGMVSHLRGGTGLPDGTVAGIVEIGFSDGPTRTFEVRVGEHTAEGLYDASVTHAQARVGGHFWVPMLGENSDEYLQGNDYVARLGWWGPAAPVRVAVRATVPQGELIVRGVSLIDERTGSFQSLILSDQGRFRLVHSGDVKIYENLDVLPRAFVVPDARMAADDEQALALMQDPAFDPRHDLVLNPVTALGEGEHGEIGPAVGTTRAHAVVTNYTPERVEIEADTGTPGYLVLTDAWYPGWEATIDGEPVPVHRADLFFRAVAVDAGRHRVVYTFRPMSLFLGAGISLLGLAGSVTLSKVGCNAIMTRGRVVHIQSAKEGDT